jgi:hypothetical protein
MRSIDDLIDGNDALRHLSRVLAAHDALLRRVRAALPDEVAPHCVAAASDGNALRLLADSGAWATRLRYLGRDLLRQLRAGGLGLSAVEVRVLPPARRPALPRHRTVRHSDDGAACLEGTAEGIDDPALRAALQSLGRRLRR